MSDLLNSYTFEAKKIVYYSVTVGANNKTEAKRIASDFEHCQHYEEVEYCEGYEYKVGKMLETTDEKWLTWRHLRQLIVTLVLTTMVNKLHALSVNNAQKFITFLSLPLLALIVNNLSTNTIGC